MASLRHQLRHVYEYFKFLDETNAKILQKLATVGPRNISALAKATRLPITTVRFRLNKMIEKGQLLVTVNPDLPKLGLAKAFLAANASLGCHDTLRKAIESTEYWTYMVRCYGKIDGYCAYFAFPHESMEEVEEYFREICARKIVTDYKLFWITNSFYNSPDFSWFDFKKKEWKLPWERWVKEILEASEELPAILREPQSYEPLVDKADLLIIKELEKDATIDLKKLAKILKITPQSVGTRYKKHIVARNLVANFNVDIYPFPLEISELFNFIIRFTDEKRLAKFAKASDKKPFIVSYAKAIDHDLLIANIYILKSEFPKLINSLNRLYSEDVITDFSYATLDPTSFRRQTISYEYFADGRWATNLKVNLNKLR
ncbi:MAG: hypothetical protein QHH24_03465 [Candidatus Bathyarchaeota archaeon]|nr:hypothetical protein [Candidatus Bathyarchaeota archaeon]